MLDAVLNLALGFAATAATLGYGVFVLIVDGVIE